MFSVDAIRNNAKLSSCYSADLIYQWYLISGVFPMHIDPPCIILLLPQILYHSGDTHAPLIPDASAAGCFVAAPRTCMEPEWKHAMDGNCHGLSPLCDLSAGAEQVPVPCRLLAPTAPIAPTAPTAPASAAPTASQSPDVAASKGPDFIYHVRTVNSSTCWREMGLDMAAVISHVELVAAEGYPKKRFCPSTGHLDEPVDWGSGPLMTQSSMPQRLERTSRMQPSWHGLKRKLEVVETSDGRGFSLTVREPIKSGEFIGEYVGVQVAPDFADQTEASCMYEDKKVECFVLQETGHCLDAKRNRNALGFINHSCVSQAEVAKLGGKGGIATVGGFNVKYVSRQGKRKEV